MRVSCWVVFFPSIYAISRQWAVLPHYSGGTWREKCWHSALVELLPQHPKLSTHKKVREELARSLGASRLSWTAHHSVLRPGYLPLAVGMCMEGWGVQLGHSQGYQHETLYIDLYWGRRRQSWKDQLPQHLPSRPWVPCAVCLSH